MFLRRNQNALWANSWIEHVYEMKFRIMSNETLEDRVSRIEAFTEELYQVVLICEPVSHASHSASHASQASHKASHTSQNRVEDRVSRTRENYELVASRILR